MDRLIASVDAARNGQFLELHQKQRPKASTGVKDKNWTNLPLVRETWDLLLLRQGSALRLRPADWPNAHLVSDPTLLGPLDDKHGTSTPFVIFVDNKTTLAGIAEIIAGDTNIWRRCLLGPFMKLEFL